jgi:hypothetical protein
MVMKTFLFACSLVVVACASENTETASVTSPTSAAPVVRSARDADDYCLAEHFGGTAEAYSKALPDCTAACDASQKDSCKILGDMYERGEGVAVDPSRASMLHAKACRLGNDKACISAPPPASTASASAGGNAHISVGSIEADGIKLANLSCDHIEGGIPGGLFGAIALVGGFKMRKAELDACGAHSDETVAWTGAHGAMTHLKATGGSVAVNRCVERALDGAPSTITGQCSAIVRRP